MASPALHDARLAKHARPASETFNLLTHLVGAVAALVGGAWLVWRANGASAKFAFAVYGASLVALLSASTFHHAVSHATTSERQLMRRLDHVSIYLLIAGTYTPVCLLAVPRPAGLIVLAVVWTLALAGISLKLFAPFTSRWVTIALYVAMGWTVVGAGPAVVHAFPRLGFWLLLGGGIVYTVGAVVYATKKPDLWPRYVGFHGIWHVFVLVAAALHFAFIAAFVPAG